MLWLLTVSEIHIRILKIKYYSLEDISRLQTNNNKMPILIVEIFHFFQNNEVCSSSI